MADIQLNSVGPNKVKVIALVREITGLGLKEAKEAVDLVEDGRPFSISNIASENLQNIVISFKELGADAIELGRENDVDDNVGSNCEEEETIKEKLDTQPVKKYKPIVPANNISRIDRESTLKVLKEVKGIAKEYESYNSQINTLSQKIKSETDVAERLRKEIVGPTKWLIRGVVLAAAIGGVFFYVIGAVIFAIIAKIVMNLTVKRAYLKKHEDENNAKADKYIQTNVEPLKEKLDYVYEERTAFFESGKKDWASDVVGQGMFYSSCIDDLYELVRSRRADTIKEALNKYDDEQHKARMEEMQQAIQNASETSAREAAKQTAQMAQIEKNTHQAARAAKASAAFDYGTYRNTRKKK